MTYKERADLAANNDFRGKVNTAAIIRAGELLKDDFVPEPEFIVQKYSSHISNNTGGSWLNTMVLHVVGSPGITLDPTDSDIQYTVNDIFTKLAKSHYANI